MFIKYSNDHKIYQQFSILGPPKFTQIGNFGLNINHLVTLIFCHYLYIIYTQEKVAHKCGLIK
jgi:hypothetical protein